MENRFQKIIAQKKKEMEKNGSKNTMIKDINKYYTDKEAIGKIYGKIIKNANIPPKFKDVNFKNFNLNQIPDVNKEKVRKIQLYSKNIIRFAEIPQSLYMFSEYNGCGKTHIAVSIIKQAAWQYAKRIFEENPIKYKRRGTNLDNFNYTPVFFMSEKNYLYKKKLAFGSNDRSLKEDVELIEKMVIKSNILVIDDFLKERNTDFTFNELTAWICLRYEQNKPVIFTSNMDFKDLALENEKNPFHNTENFKNATYLASRISEMTKGYQYAFDSSRKDDYRQMSY